VGEIYSLKKLWPNFGGEVAEKLWKDLATVFFTNIVLQNE
jgi:hypothetical protein